MNHSRTSPSKYVSHPFQLTTACVALLAAALLAACGTKDDSKTKSTTESATPAAPAAPAVPATRATASKSGAAPGARPVLTVNITKPQATDWPVRLSANGNIVAWQEAIIGAEGNGLRLNDIRVNVGDVVKKGQVLATFAAETSRADVTQLQANVAEAEAALAEAQANAARARTLQDSGAISAQQINQYVTAEKTAAARLAATKAQAQSSQLRLGFTRVIAPDDGVISGRMATVGSVVGTGQEMFRLIRQNRLEWRAEVTASELSKVIAGQKVAITTPSGDMVQGRVRVVAPTVDAQTRNAIAYVDLDKSSASKPGMFAKGEFDLSNSKAIHVPQTAIVARDGFSFVMRVEPNNKVTQLKVQTARRVGDRVEIKDGVKEGETLVASGAAFLTEGDTVRIAAVAAASNSTTPQPKK